ncbi:LysR family transcriptional regulator [Oceanobacillus chungangensis]|uniref:LysR family transcriptional regulator n=1 Tax=Oceanobacillus chungangensis TaxID=1229152 RepID=A0A3D8PHW0_9BACI|nr:LysR family transcriptional regulator [Oceanobacillus chungangensis]RDW15644.1 LysR family transcriptional regulator [Oceanobacillus chungangensis]
MEQQLKIFIEVVERKSFSRAAKSLYMSQPAVSQYIASLEKELGVRLLERSNKFVQVNRAGKIVYQYAKDIIRNYDQMKLLVSDIKNNPSGQLKIGASYTIGEYLLPKILARLQVEFPKIIPSVFIGNTEDIGKKLIHHEIDIGLIEGQFVHPQILSEKFSTDKMYIITGGRQSLKGEVTISNEKLEQQTWIIREQGSGTREVLEDFFKKNHIHPKRVIILGSTQTIKEGVESGLGISLLSELTLNKELQLHTIKKLEVEGTPIQRDFSIIKNHHEFHPKALQTFESLVKSSLVE